MSRICKVAAFAAAILILAAPVFAQTEIESNTYKATAGVFTNEIDDSMSVIDYAGVEFEKWFGFIGYGGYNGDTPIQVGFATKLGGLYVGLFFTGNAMGIDENWNEEVETTYDLDSQLKTNIKTTKQFTTGTQVSSNNEFGLLLGVADMGFKIGFWENVTEILDPERTIETTDALTGTIYHDKGDIVNYSHIEGILSPSLTWGTTFDVGSFQIKPKIKFGIGFGLDSTVDNYRLNYTYTPPGPDGNPPGNWDGPGSSYDTEDGKVVGPETIYYTGYNGRYIRPDFEAGATIDFENFSLDFSYGLGISVYSNSYNDSGFSGDVKGTVSWSGNTETSSSIDTTTTTKHTILDIEELTDISHSIHLGFYKDKEVAEGLKLGIYAGVDFGISSTNTDAYTLVLERTEVKYNNDALSSNNYSTETERRGRTETADPGTYFPLSENVSEFTLEPFVNIGASYALFPGRFTINTGIGLRPFGYTSIITKSSSKDEVVTKTKNFNSNGDVISENVTVGTDTPGNGQTYDNINVQNKLSYLDAGLCGGFVFYFTDKLSLDLTVNGIFSGIGSSNFELNGADVTVMLGFKF